MRRLVLPARGLAIVIAFVLALAGADAAAQQPSAAGGPAPSGEPPRPSPPERRESAPQTPAETDAPRLARIAGPACFRAGDLVTIEGRNLRTPGGRRLRLEGPAGPRVLDALAWQDSLVVLRLPRDLDWPGGRRYRLRLADRAGQALPETAPLPITLCSAAAEAPPAAPGPAAPTPAGEAEPDQALVLTVASGADPLPVVGALGYRLVRRVSLSALDLELLQLGLPAGRTLDAAVAELRAALPGASVDVNALYRLQGGGRDYARRAIGWPADGRCAAGGAGVSVGLIDSGLDLAHRALASADIRVRSFLDAGAPPAPRDHGTAVAGLLVGAAGETLPGGLLPRARLYAAAAFRGGTTPRAATLTIAEALDWLVGEDVRVVNLSFAGARNAVFGAAVAQAGRLGVVMVAAAGNFGPEAAPAFPAAEPAVVAVTALDARERPYRHANRGDYIDFAAPGVDVWLPRPGGGGAYRSGTSFAAPFVAAVAAAQLAVRPGLAAGLVSEALRRDARDLGAVGRDRLFGWGLVQATRICAGE